MTGDWLDVLARLRAGRTAAVLVTVADVRGHAPREAGAKMVVTLDGAWGSVGGGNLEERAIRRSRDLLAAGTVVASTESTDLSDRAPGEYGVQCCGGEVTLLFEPVPVRPSVAIFGMGHVGLELALLLSRHELDLHLVDSRADQLDDARLAGVAAGPARVHVHREPLLPELVIATLPRGTDVLVMTHDHAEDLALLDALLRTPASVGSIGLIGLIGSSAKWTRFRARLTELGHDDQALARVVTPIGDPSVTRSAGDRAKRPEVIALAVAVDVLVRAGRAAATLRASAPPSP
ncbi:xanthine dehydrogenase accessory protein XdhC [Nocardioides caeni]|uniref:Xanthine dehydrogenase accessory protein XdhC n=2 Tax=Nocardioides caeni TaxID=574700 RepID=A0A4S8N837_9ACTN|nr:xanthine dehydrogenase accessory protein XdhC [Nocardioides caeni]